MRDKIGVTKILKGVVTALVPAIAISLEQLGALGFAWDLIPMV